MQFSINPLEVVVSNLQGLMIIQNYCAVWSSKFLLLKAGIYSEGMGQCKRYRIN